MASIPGITQGPTDNPGYAAGFGTPTLEEVNAGAIVNSSAQTTAGITSQFNNIIGGINFGNLGQGVQDLFQATGDRLEAKNYEEAQHLAEIEKSVTEQSTAIQQAQAGRQIEATIGAQKSGVAAGGFTETGSALSLLQNSAQQAALTHQVIAQQGLLTETSQQAQADAYGNMASAAKNAATGATVGGVVGIIGSVAKLFGL